MTSPEINPQPISPEAQETFNALLLNPAFQAAMQVAVTEGVKNTLANEANDLKEDFVPDYNSLTEEQYEARSEEDDRAYEDRIQRGREDFSNDINSFFPENAKPEPTPASAAAKYRPYTAILRDIGSEKVSPSMVDPYQTGEIPSKLDVLTDELATRITLESTDYSVKGADQDNTRQELLLDLQARGSLSDDEVMSLIDKIADYDDLMVNSENLIDDVFNEDGGLTDQLFELVAIGKQPRDFFRDADGKTSPAFKAIDTRLKQILDKIDNPIIRQVVLKGTNTELQRQLRRAERVAESRKIDPIVIKPLDIEPIVKPVVDEIEKPRLSTAAEQLEQKINDRAQKISDHLAEKTKELGSWIKALDSYYEYIEGEIAPEYAAGNKTPFKLSESSTGKSIWRGVAKFVEEYKTARDPLETKDDLDAAIQKELAVLRNVFDKSEKPAPAPVKPAKHNKAPKASKNTRGARIVAGFKNIRKANIAKK